jgi:small subunit ribosomal protein S4
VVYRAKFVSTMFAARQFINHGHIKVNGKRVNIASYKVKVGDVIEIKEASSSLSCSKPTSSASDTPDYLEVDHGKQTAKITRIPGLWKRRSRFRWNRT